MPMDRFLIAPFNTGLQTNLRPWLIMDDAFESLQNAYVFRGRVRKRFGSYLMGLTQLSSRLRTSLVSGGAGVGITDAGGNAAGNVRTITGFAALPLNQGQMFSIGSQIYTVSSALAGVQPMLATSGAATFNLTNGDFTFTGAPALTTIFFYPSQPVVGIDQYESGATNNHPTYAFDPSFAYTFTAGAWVRSGTAVWHGNPDGTNFMWTTNWQGNSTSSNTGVPVLFATNFKFTLGAGTPTATDDPIWYMTPANTWVAMLGSSVNGIFFLPGGGARAASPFVQTARIIVPFKGRLLLLNTVENDNSGGAGTGVATQYVNRCRFSWFGSPLAVNAWYEPGQTDAAGNVAGGGSWIDASTQEQIISAEFIKDRLIVYFERSTWELAYTGNQTDPFSWNKLNTELGSQSTFSTVPFDQEILTIGNTGIHACNGSNVARIDEKIPDEIFEFKAASNGNLRTFGIRDYFAECVYWTFVSNLEEPTQTFPNQVLVYNYRNDTWALNDDCFTAFGYFEQQPDLTWANSAPVTWEQSNEIWESGELQANQRIIVAGNQEGFVVRLSTDANPGRNSAAMQITNVASGNPAVNPWVNQNGILTLTIVNHNLTIDEDSGFGFPDYILLESFVDANLLILNGKIFPVNSVVDANTITIDTNILFFFFGIQPVITGTYSGGATVARVSNVEILTKQWNPYDKESRNVYLSKIDFAVQNTGDVRRDSSGNVTSIVGGQITVDYYPSSTGLSMIQESYATNSNVGTNVLETTPYSPSLYPLEEYQDRLWHPIYFQSSGECIQLEMFMTIEQMVTPTISLSDFELEGMVLHTSRTSDRLQ